MPSIEAMPTDDQSLMHFFGVNFHKEWDGVVEVPFLDTLIPPTEQLNIKHLLPLESDTPFGNLQTAWVTLLGDISAINIQIQRTNQDHFELRKFLKSKDQHTMPQGLFVKQRINAEGLTQSLKTLVDRLIMLMTVVQYSRENEGKYPKRIVPDSVGAFVGLEEGEFCGGAIDKFRPILKRLNNVSNALKHTFLNLQSSSIINRQTPGIIVFYQHKNRTDKGSYLEYVIFSNTVKEINEFASVVKGFLKGGR